MNPDCISVEAGIRLGVFPGDCPHVRDVADYVAPRLGMTPEEIEAYAEEVAEVRDCVRQADGSPLPLPAVRRASAARPTGRGGRRGRVAPR